MSAHVHIICHYKTNIYQMKQATIYYLLKENIVKVDGIVPDNAKNYKNTPNI